MRCPVHRDRSVGRRREGARHVSNRGDRRCGKNKGSGDHRWKQRLQLAVLAKKAAISWKKLFHACVDNGLCILEMSQMTRSLEDIFLELTESTKSGQEEA